MFYGALNMAQIVEGGWHWMAKIVNGGFESWSISPNMGKWWIEGMWEKNVH